MDGHRAASSISTSSLIIIISLTVSLITPGKPISQLPVEV